MGPGKVVTRVAWRVVQSKNNCHLIEYNIGLIWEVFDRGASKTCGTWSFIIIAFIILVIFIGVMIYLPDGVVFI